MLHLWWALSVLAENRGQDVRFHHRRRPRGGMLLSFFEERMRHLAAAGWITWEPGADSRLGLGSRTERLGREYSEAFLQRARERDKADKAARTKAKATSLG